jgi:hypothetical protein
VSMETVSVEKPKYGVSRIALVWIPRGMLSRFSSGVWMLDLGAHKRFIQVQAARRLIALHTAFGVFS